MYKIPVTSEPDQSFSCSIPIGGKNTLLGFRIRYNDIARYWWMAISDSKGNMLLDSIPLLTGSNILGQYQYLSIGSAYIINNGNSLLSDPDESTLGTDFLLMWGD